jgi:hypothetical protein
MSEAGLLKALAAIESYLVRRTICRMTTKNYNHLFLDLQGLLNQCESSEASDIVVNFLLGQTAESSVWPSDALVRDAMTDLPLYQLLTRGRMRMLLEAVEDHLRTPKTEDAHVAKSLTIEHVMPQGWRKNWSISPDALPEAAGYRDRVVHTIGNLTLATKWLNPDLSNLPWHEKREKLVEHTVLKLNRRLLDLAGDDWNEASIEARSHELTELVLNVWPRP